MQDLIVLVIFVLLCFKLFRCEDLLLFFVVSDCVVVKENPCTVGNLNEDFIFSFKEKNCELIKENLRKCQNNQKWNNRCNNAYILYTGVKWAICQQLLTCAAFRDCTECSSSMFWKLPTQKTKTKKLRYEPYSGFGEMLCPQKQPGEIIFVDILRINRYKTGKMNWSLEKLTKIYYCFDK